MISDIWRICIVEDEEALNQNLVNALRKDGYEVRGITRNADAIHVLWSEEFDVVIFNLKAPETDSLEVLQWLHASRPNIRIIAVGAANSLASHAQALESGAVSYLEKPLDLRVLKDELRRLSQNSGFTASLDSFDLLDVIQIINMSRKTIALLINTGLEEHGTLGFQNGDLIWAEYGMLRGEEAFFALAAHKNGTVTQQFLDEYVHANVTQPLSRLIFQALQYRTKYANAQQNTGEQEDFASPTIVPFSTDDIDDRPFVFSPTQEEQLSSQRTLNHTTPVDPLRPAAVELPMQTGDVGKEWWQRTGQIERVYIDNIPRLDAAAVPTSAMRTLTNETGNATPAYESETPSTNAPVELPSWLTDQPTSHSMPTMQPPGLSASDITLVPLPPSPPAKRQPTRETMDDLAPQWSELLQQPTRNEPETHLPWQGTESLPPTPVLWQPEFIDQSERLTTNGNGHKNGTYEGLNGSITTVSSSNSGYFETLQDSNPMLSTSSLKALRVAAKRNYAALVSALQTLGYSIVGFIAAAVVSIDGHPVAQVAIDDLDIANICRYFSTIQKNALQALGNPEEDKYEEIVITSSTRYTLMRIVASDTKAFLVLITTREANPTESLEVMTNVEGAISAALR
jgi:DNA-binding response OmpR family regulator/predicted regulator of Ras-like GTPase activity (Roadblock/LC7/MglB family)